MDKDPDAHLELALAFKLAMRVALAARASSDAGRTIPEDSAPPTALASPAIVEAILRRPADRARMLPLDHIFLERCPKPPTLRNPGQISWDVRLLCRCSTANLAYKMKILL